MWGWKTDRQTKIQFVRFPFCFSSFSLDSWTLCNANASLSVACDWSSWLKRMDCLKFAYWIGEVISRVGSFNDASEGRYLLLQNTVRPAACRSQTVSHPSFSPRLLNKTARMTWINHRCSYNFIWIHLPLWILWEKCKSQQLDGHHAWCIILSDFF